MKKILFRLVAICLTLAILCAPVCAFAAEAQGGDLAPIAEKEEGTRFLFSNLYDENKNNYSFTDSAPVLLDLSFGSVFSGGAAAVSSNGGTNTLYLALVNKSNATEISLTYHYISFDAQLQTVKQTLQAGTDKLQRYYLSTPYIDSLTGVTISFSNGENELDGTVILHSFYNLSIFDEADYDEATVEACYYDSESKTVKISGSLSYAATVRYAGGTLALFAIGPDEELYLFNQTPVARAGVSFSFSFSLNVESAEDLYSRYVVAAVSKTGERIPLCRPLYPDIAPVSVAAPGGYKGFHTADFSDAITAGVGVEIVDVYFDKLEGSQNDGILYAGDRSYYYFDKTYVGLLDKQIRNLSGSGATVYLRFLVSGDSNGLPFASYTEDSTGIFNKAILVNSDTAMFAVAAFTDFLVSRYADDSDIGGVDGIILGRAADAVDFYNYAATRNLEQYTSFYSAALSVIAGVASFRIPDLDILVPFSDDVSADTISSADLNSSYTSIHTLYSLLLAMESTSLTPTRFTVIMESDTVPQKISGGKDKGCGIDGVSAVLDDLKLLAERFSFFDHRLIYLWMPRSELSFKDLEATYALQYVYLKTMPRVSAYIADLSLLSANDRKEAISALSYLVGRIDTDRFAETVEPVLRYLGASSFEALYPGFQPSSLQTHNLFTTVLTKSGYTSGVLPSGAYTLYGFSNAVGVQGFYDGQNCSELSVLSGAFGKTLTAKCKAGGGYAEIAQSFKTVQDFSFAPYLCFRLGIDGAADTPYEIRIQLIGKEMTAFASCVLSSGVSEDLYLDLSAHADKLTSLYSLRIAARPLDGDTEDYTLCLQSISLQSSTLDDEELADRIEKAGLDTNDGAEKGEQRKDRTTAIVVTVALAVCSVAVTAVLLSKHHNHKNKRKETE